MSNAPTNTKKTSVDEPRPEEDYIRIIPLGGLEEVGMNCCLVEVNESLLMLDCGLTFPDTRNYGVDLVIPDWSYVLENLDYLDAIILTHGHEDHIGALPFFLREVDVPVYGGRLTLAMLKRKLEEYGLANDVRMHPVEPGDRLKIQETVVEFVHVNHSIPNAMSVAMETPLGRIVFTGDWKIDQTPLYEPVTDLQRFAEFGREGTLALLGDSTNSGSPGYAASERAVQEGLADVLDTAPGRVVVAQFSSNLHRIQGMLELAEQFDRKVLLVGGSLMRNFETALELGFIKVPNKKLIVEPRQLSGIPDDELLIISTGSQGEPRSALTRMAYGDHHIIDLREGDTVVLSARVIPGNEASIARMIDNIARRGATVITGRSHPVHASGHAKQEELKLLLNLVRPKHLVPVHGSFHMRAQHAALASKVGISSSLIIDEGDVLQFTADEVRVIDRVHTGHVFVDDSRTNDVEDIQIRDRKKLAQSGLIMAFVVLNRTTAEITGGPDLLQRGFLNDEDAHLLEAASAAARSAIEALPKKARTDSNEVAEALRNAIRRFFRQQLSRKPVVVPIVHEM